MKFQVTPEEAERPARAVAAHFKKKRMKVRSERAAWPTAPYSTTITAQRASFNILVEAQGAISYGRPLKELVGWMGAQRHNAEFHIATLSTAVLQAGVLAEMKADGVGLLIVDENGKITEHQRARNPALVVTPDPVLAYGSEKAEVQAAIEKFNTTDRKDGLRDMCEIVERLTEELGVRASRKGWIKTPELNFKKKDWSDQINELARKDVYHPGRVPLVTPAMKDDLHSFRSGRNLVDHKARTKRDNLKRQKQFAERMVQGPRLVSDLVSLKRKVK